MWCVCVVGDIASQLKDTAGIERSIQHMQNDMIKLNVLLHRERGIEHGLQQSNVLMENDFIGALKVRDDGTRMAGAAGRVVSVDISLLC